MATTPLPSRASATLMEGRQIRNAYLAHMRAKWQHQPCLLGDPQRSAREQKSEMATYPTCGQNGYITLTILGLPNAQTGHKNLKWLLATSAFPSQGSPTLSMKRKKQKQLPRPHVGTIATSPCRLGGPQCSAWGQPSQIATCPTCGLGSNITPTVSGSPTLGAGTKVTNGYVAHMWAKWLHHPGRLKGTQRSMRDQNCKLLHGPHVGKVVTAPLPSRGSLVLSMGTKITNGYMAHKWTN